MTDHDTMFKELVSTFFLEFIKIFAPDILTYMDMTSLVSLDKEVTDRRVKQRPKQADLVMRATFSQPVVKRPRRRKSKTAFFLIHIEAQSTARSDFPRRMYRYFNRLLDKYDLPIYPIALLSYDTPLKAAPSSFTVAFPKKKVLQFDYDVVQLNRLNWQDFIDKPSPITSALMAKMHIAEQDRPRAKVACLKMMLGLKLDEEQKLLISDFIGTYLDLNAAEEAEYQRQLAEELPEEEEEQAMTVMNGWVRQGMTETLLKLIILKVGPVSPKIEEQVKDLRGPALDELTTAVLNFKTQDDVTRWLAEHSKN